MRCHLGRFMVAYCMATALFSNDTTIRQSGTVATVNGEVITAAELEKTLRPQIEAMEDRLRQLREATLHRLIDNLLLRQAAQKQGINVDEYLQTRVESVAISSAEVDRAYAGSRDQFPGILPAEAKYRIRRTMEDNARAAALKNLLSTMRQEARITNALMADIMGILDAAAHEGPAAGRPDAPVIILEFSDFECPYCRAAQPILKRIMERWPGKVRHLFKHFPLEQHAHAMQAARAAVCAGQQEQFWAMHDRIFAAEDLSETVLREAAVGAGLRMAEFDNCMRSEEAESHVRKDMFVGRTAGVMATPAFFVKGELVPASGLEAAVEKILGGAR